MSFFESSHFKGGMEEGREGGREGREGGSMSVGLDPRGGQ